jgi:hypothetical protein
MSQDNPAPRHTSNNRGVDLETIPKELIERDQWVLWARELREGKLTKVPYTSMGRRASTTDPSTWLSFEDAWWRFQSWGDGLGYVFSKDDPFAGADFDACLEGQELHPCVFDWVGRLDSYSEVSQSLAGIHVIVRAELKRDGHRTGTTPWGGNFEVYDRSRFFAFTGLKLDGAPSSIEDRQDELDALVAELLPEPAPSDTTESQPPPNHDLTDEQLLAKARSANNGEKFRRLFDEGGISEHGDDDSAADQALCNLLAFWTGPDPERIDRLFRLSALVRDKWERADYRRGTINKALEGRTEFFGSKAREGSVKDETDEAEKPQEKQPVDPADDFASVLDQVAAFLRRYVWFPSKAYAHTIAVWVAHTHAIDAFEATAYLYVSSPEKRSGKTLLQETLEFVVREPLRVSNTSVAALFRRIERVCPTLLFDETDAIFGGSKKRLEGAEELRGILNAGHRQGAVVLRCVGQGAKLTDQTFEVFCPKVLAGIGQLLDTIADRSIPIRMQRRRRSEKVERFRRREAVDAAEPLREQLEAWAEAHVEELRAARPEVPDELDDRAVDGWEPLLAIAGLAGGPWPDRIRQAARELHAGKVDEVSLGTLLLSQIRDAFGWDADARRFRDDAPDRLSTNRILFYLVDQEEGPWARWWERDLEAEPQARTKSAAMKLSSLLKPFGVKSRTIKLPIDDSAAKGFMRDDFTTAFERWLDDHPQTPDEASEVVTPPVTTSRSSRRNDAGQSHFSEETVEEAENGKTASDPEGYDVTTSGSSGSSPEGGSTFEGIEEHEDEDADDFGPSPFDDDLDRAFWETSDGVGL